MTRQLMPASWPGAVQELARHQDVVVVAGGTTAQPLLTARPSPPAALLHLAALPGAVDVTPTGERMRIGAMVAVADDRLAFLRPPQGLAWFATPAVRRRATLVGNLASPIGPNELTPLVLACAGTLHVVDRHGELGTARPGAGVLPAGSLAVALELVVPARVAYARRAVRARSSRAEVAVAAAHGTGTGVVVALGPTAADAARVIVVPRAEPLLADPGAERDLVAEVRSAAASAGAREARLDVVAGLAARVLRDLHAPVPVPDLGGGA